MKQVNGPHRAVKLRAQNAAAFIDGSLTNMGGIISGLRPFVLTMGLKLLLELSLVKLGEGVTYARVLDD